ncbi:hypothetical protein N9N03_02965 [Chlamydiia bacterium]|nr:hypothetical protein [Chlamydiia bacterium]
MSIHDHRLMLWFNFLYNMVAFPFAIYSYQWEFVEFALANKSYLIPLLPVSGYMYISFAVYFAFRLFSNHVPSVLTAIAFYLNFVWGNLCMIHFPIFMMLVSGVNIYFSWCIITHGYVTYLSYVIFPKVQKVSQRVIVSLFVAMFIKNYADLYLGTLSYMEHENLVAFYVPFRIIIFSLQALGLYLLFTKREQKSVYLT